MSFSTWFHNKKTQNVLMFVTAVLGVIFTFWSVVIASASNTSTEITINTNTINQNSPGSGPTVGTTLPPGLPPTTGRIPGVLPPGTGGTQQPGAIDQSPGGTLGDATLPGVTRKPGDVTDPGYLPTSPGGASPAPMPTISPGNHGGDGTIDAIEVGPDQDRDGIRDGIGHVWERLRGFGQDEASGTEVKVFRDQASGDLYARSGNDVERIGGPEGATIALGGQLRGSGITLEPSLGPTTVTAHQSQSNSFLPAFVVLAVGLLLIGYSALRFRKLRRPIVDSGTVVDP